MKEEELALHIVKHFERLGYEVYKEVAMFGGGSMRADIYCLKDGETISIETKMGMGLKVIEQAFRWRMNANFAYIAVPYKHKADYRFALEICRDYGIGVIYYYPKNGQLEVKILPALNSEPNNPKLYEEQKDSIAGNAKSEFVTPFKLTCKQLIDYISVKGGKVGVKEAIRNIKHHYANDNSAENSLKKMVTLNVLEGVKLIRESKIHYFTIDESKV
jgi:hypothetical protein